MIISKINITSYKYPFLLCLIYILANFLMLFNNGIFWDDWTLYNMPFEELKNMFIHNGAYYAGIAHFHFFLNSLSSNPSLVYKFITFLLGLINVLLFYKILAKIFNKNDAFIMALIYACLPMNMAKITMICLPYTLCLFFYILAFYLYNFHSQNILARFFSLILFFISFITNSLIVFYLLIIPSYYYLLNIRKIELKTVLTFIKARLDFLVLPFVYFIYKSIWLAPLANGLYAQENYYAITWEKLITLPKNYIHIIQQNSFGLFLQLSKSILWSNYIFFIFIFLFIFFIYIFRHQNFEKKGNLKIYLFLAIFTFFTGTIAYILIAKIAIFQGYDSRHQLLIIFSFSIFFFVSFSTLFKEKYRYIVLSFIISLAIVSTIEINFNYLKAWFKQEAIALHFKQTDFTKLHNLIVVEDNALAYNYYQEPYRFYELGGIYKKVFHKTDKAFKDVYAIPEDKKCEYAFNFFETRKLDKIYHLNTGDFILKKECSKMKIYRNEEMDLDSFPNILKLLYHYYTNKNKFNKLVNKVCIIEVE